MISRRRRINTIVGVVLALAAPIATLVGGLVIDAERIAAYWTLAQIGDVRQDSLITEAIDYDFGIAERHGILREIPDLDPEEGVRVSSATAPTQTRIGFGVAPVVRVGDPDSTITGRHRYLLEYSLDTLVLGDRFSWNAVGTGWDVSISNAEIHVISENELLTPTCDRGRRGSFGNCTVEEVAPGHILVVTEGLDSGEGVTVSGTLGASLAETPALPPLPEARALGEDVPIFVLMVASFLAAVATVPMMARSMKRWGREQVPNTTASMLGDPANLDFSEGYRLVDQSDLGQLANPSPSPPKGLSAPHGGMILAERVKPEHMVSWLVEAAFLGEIQVEEDDEGHLVLQRGGARPRPSTAERIESFFSDGDRISLEKYNSDFSSSWKELGTDLERWQRDSGFWDPAGDRRRRRAIGWGIPLGLLSIAGIVLGSGFSLRFSGWWVCGLIVSSAGLGASIAVLSRAWELRVRTPEGTTRWLAVESFRRFLTGLEPGTAVDTVDPDAIRDYTSWAVAFGLDDQWKKVAAALQGDSRYQTVPPTYFRMAHIGPSIQRATTTASTSPSSSGGGGGGVGGGGGGGGGGSW